MADKLDTTGVEEERFPWRRQKEKIKMVERWAFVVCTCVLYTPLYYISHSSIYYLVKDFPTRSPVSSPGIIWTSFMIPFVLRNIAMNYCSDGGNPLKKWSLTSITPMWGTIGNLHEKVRYLAENMILFILVIITCAFIWYLLLLTKIKSFT